MRRIVLALLVVFLFTSLTVAAPKKRVAILDFDFASIQHWWEGSWDIGKGIADILVTRLVNDGTYSVVERKALDAIIAEQNFSNSDRANPSTAAQLGKVLGVDCIIVGSITQFGTEDKKLGIGGFGGRLGGFGGAKVGTSKGKAKVIINTRMVDVNTAEILAVAEGKGESARSGLLLGGVGGGGGGFGGGEIDMGSSNFRDTILGEATHAAVDDVAQQLIASADRVPTHKIEIRGLVADVDGNSLVLNVGKSQGVSAGDTLKILRVTRTVKDPATGKVLREVTTEVGACQVGEVDDNSCVATVTSGSGVRVNDLVRNQ
jgi:curli biogenesis system outer membrane secretion channel CsgG